VIDEARSARSRHEHAVPELPERVTDDQTDRLFDALLIQDALAAVSPEHREVVIAAYYRGRSVGEVAAELGIPEGTVKSRMHYGLRALRLALQERGVTR
jgi:RNA polymerase sigma-70 factor (ECF subfamily)